MSARQAKNAFGLMIDAARAEPALIEKPGRSAVTVISAMEYERLNGVATSARPQSGGAPNGRVGKRGNTERT